MNNNILAQTTEKYKLDPADKEEFDNSALPVNVTVEQLKSLPLLNTCKHTQDFPCLLPSPSEKCCLLCLEERATRINAIRAELRAR